MVVAVSVIVLMAVTVVMIVGLFRHLRRGSVAVGRAVCMDVPMGIVPVGMGVGMIVGVEGLAFNPGFALTATASGAHVFFS